ncbi:hypothetical protein BCR36DRAFT_402294 [Piromyces finnis]|uniref:Uncharacterized protein n=1 Tax=Piromyces finnis TaxID=1754191 RepID=A0A1Y1VJV1_9FUNG|nr:hypothetical protein BCR36DRAFT_402294 [Piromyces finnis]|eukprot:ORX57954.1 hypothetical protein BCR36DRAFT_402294 [Piromyces finnis]
MFKNILKFVALLSLSSVCFVNADSPLINENAAKNVSLEYTKDGVLRKEDQCFINFANFGIKNDIVNISVKKESNNDGSFNLRIGELKNGNEGLNNYKTGYRFTDGEIKDYVKIKQNNVEIKDFSVASVVDGKFSLLIKNLKSCDGLSIKQVYKTEALMATYLYYSNVSPLDINHAFDIAEFGPSSNNVPYDMIHWDMNTGLDRVREQCRIYIDYNRREQTGGNHWIWYLSTDNINGEKCDNTAFYKAAKSSYIDYEQMDELFGDYYEGYVIKREGSENGHMDGILVNQKYLIEIYQDGCSEQNKDQVICTISSNRKLGYEEFQKEFVDNCLDVIVDQKEKAEWSVNVNNITAKFSQYSINIENYNRGSLPKCESESVSYKEFKAAESSGIARFTVNMSCGEGTFIGDKCRCSACPVNCASCLDGKTCTKCKEGSTLIDGKCVCSKGFISNEEGVCVIEPTTIIEEEVTEVKDEEENTKEEPSLSSDEEEAEVTPVEVEEVEEIDSADENIDENNDENIDENVNEEIIEDEKSTELDENDDEIKEEINSTTIRHITKTVTVMRQTIPVTKNPATKKPKKTIRKCRVKLHH